MAIEFSEILLEVVGRRASDLHLTAGAPPTLRERGALVAINGYGPLTPDDTREFIYSILSTEQRRRLETDLQLGLRLPCPRQGPLPCQRVPPARRTRCRLPPDPPPDGRDRRSRAAGDRTHADAQAARSGARHRSDRLRQDDLACGDDRRINSTRAEHIITIEDRSNSCTRTRSRSSTSVSLGLTRRASALRCALRSARTPM